MDDPIPELEEGSDEEILKLEPTSVESSGMTEPESNWQADNANIPTWQNQWRATQDPAVAWPMGIRLHFQQMIWEGRICIPENRVEETIGLHHRTTGHVGIKRLVNDLMRRYQWLYPSIIQGLAQKSVGSV